VEGLEDLVKTFFEVATSPC